MFGWQKALEVETRRESSRAAADTANGSASLHFAQINGILKLISGRKFVNHKQIGESHLRPFSFFGILGLLMFDDLSTSERVGSRYTLPRAFRAAPSKTTDRCFTGLRTMAPIVCNPSEIPGNGMVVDPSYAPTPRSMSSKILS